MYGVHYEITKPNVLQRVSPYEIFRFYIPWFQVGASIKTPFANENKPSFWTKSFNDGGVYFVDHARGLKGDCFDLVMTLFSLDFFGALERINEDMKLGLGTTSLAGERDVRWHLDLMSRAKKEAVATEITMLSYRPCIWLSHDSHFWQSHSVIPSVIIQLGIQAIDGFWINDYYHKADKFAYAWKTGNGRVKIYQPFSKDLKWRSNTNNEALQGEHILPEKGPLLMLQSSQKDIGCILSRYGIPCVAPNGEHGNIPVGKLEDFEQRFDRIGVMYDTDSEGIKAATKVSAERDYEMFVLPTVEDCKDPSEFCKKGFAKELDLFFKIVVNYK